MKNLSFGTKNKGLWKVLIHHMKHFLYVSKCTDFASRKWGVFFNFSAILTVIR